MLKDKGVEAIAIYDESLRDTEFAKEHELKIVKRKFLKNK